MRHIAIAPIIHYEVAKKYDMKEFDVKEDKIIELCETYKHLIEEQNEQIFINYVIDRYGDFLSTNQSETE
jgi:hypothetical protein